MDEEESEMTLPFWYLFQEALWSTDFIFPGTGMEMGMGDGDEEVVAKQGGCTCCAGGDGEGGV